MASRFIKFPRRWTPTRKTNRVRNHEIPFRLLRFPTQKTGAKPSTTAERLRGVGYTAHQLKEIGSEFILMAADLRILEKQGVM